MCFSKYVLSERLIVSTSELCVAEWLLTKSIGSEMENNWVHILSAPSHAEQVVKPSSFGLLWGINVILSKCKSFNPVHVIESILYMTGFLKSITMRNFLVCLKVTIGGAPG